MVVCLLSWSFVAHSAGNDSPVRFVLCDVMTMSLRDGVAASSSFAATAVYIGLLAAVDVLCVLMLSFLL